MKASFLSSEETSEAAPSTDFSPDTIQPNPLFQYIADREWDSAIERVRQCPAETTHWEVAKADTERVEERAARIFALHLSLGLDPPLILVKKLIANAPVAVTFPDREGRRPLHLAARKSSLEIVDLLLRIHPDSARVRERKYGCLPLHTACNRRERDNGDAEEISCIVGRLLETFPEAALCRDSKNGWLPMHVATRNGAPALAIMGILKSNPKAATIGDNDRRFPIHYVCRYASNWHEEQLVAIVEGLCESYPEGLKRRDGKFGFTPLHTACSMRNVSLPLISLLLKYAKAAVSIPDYDHCLPLHIATRSRAPPGVLHKLLVAQPETAMDLDRNGRIPLHWACHVDACVDCVDILLHFFPAGAGVAERKYGLTPLHVAVQQKAKNALISTLLLCYPNAARLKDNQGSLPIHLCCKNVHKGSPTVVEMLIHAYPESFIVKDYKGRKSFDLLNYCNDDSLKSAILKILPMKP